MILFTYHRAGMNQPVMQNRWTCTEALLYITILQNVENL